MRELSVKLTVHDLKAGGYRLIIHRTGFRANDAYSAYIDMGAPKDLTPAQLDQLRKLTRDLPQTDRVVRVGKSGSCKLSLPMRSNDVVLVTLDRIGTEAPPGRTEGGLRF
jgi:xylan 1,4-beta-xylosidase